MELTHIDNPETYQLHCTQCDTPLHPDNIVGEVQTNDDRTIPINQCIYQFKTQCPKCKVLIMWTLGALLTYRFLILSGEMTSGTLRTCYYLGPITSEELIDFHTQLKESTTLC